MFGALFRVGQQFGRERLVFAWCAAAPPRAGDRADGHGLVPEPDQDFGAGADDLEHLEIEITQERCRIHPPQGPVKRERRQAERGVETLRQHDLKDIACTDIILGGVNHRRIALRRCVREASRRGQAGHIQLRIKLKRCIERGNHGIDPFARRLMCSPCADAGSRADGCNHRNFVLHRIEDHHDRRPDEDGIGKADPCGLARRQPLHQPHHVIAEIAEQPRSHRQINVAGLEAASRDQAPQAGEGLVGERFEIRRGGERTRHADLSEIAAPDKVGLQSDHRVAPAHSAALDRLEQERRALGEGPELQEGSDRCLAITDQHVAHDLALAGCVGLREAFKLIGSWHARGAFSVSSRRRRWRCAAWSG